MSYQFFKKTFAFFILLSVLQILGLSFGINSVHAWATVYGQVTYQGRGLNNVIVVDHTTKSTAISGDENNYDRGDKGNRESVLAGSTVTGGDGAYIFDRVDCAADPASRYISVEGFVGGVPPAGVPAGGIFTPQTILLGDFNNGAIYGPFNYDYVPPATPTPIPPPTNTPVPIPTATPTPTITPTPTALPTITPIPTPTIYCVHETCYRGNTVVSGPTPVSGNSPNNLVSNSALAPTPTIVRFEILPDEYFMGIQLGNIRPIPTPR